MIARHCTSRNGLAVLSFLALMLLPFSSYAMGHGGGGGGRGGGGNGGNGGGGNGNGGNGNSGNGGGGNNGGGPGGGQGGGPGGGGQGGNGGGGGGGGGKHGNDNADTPQMVWYDSLDTAMTTAAKSSEPILAVIYRYDTPSDKQSLDLMASWPQAIKLSTAEMAAVKVRADSDKGKAWVAQLNIKAFPFIVWLDPYGNAVCGLQYPFTAVDIGNLVTGWKATLDSVVKLLKEHNSRGEALLAKGKLREAYIEFSWVTPFKGPESDNANADMLTVQQAWMKLFELARQSPPDSRDRAALLKGLRKDTEGLAFAKTLEKAILDIDAPKTVAQADQPPPAAAPDVPVAASVSKPAVASAMPAVENKTLKQLASMPPPPANAAPESDDSLVDTHLLANSPDKRMKTAEQAIEDGVAVYKRAFADGTDRGEERNRMLKEAKGFFDIALKMLEDASGGKPDAQTDKLMARISMLVYGCLKYQTL